MSTKKRRTRSERERREVTKRFLGREAGKLIGAGVRMLADKFLFPGIGVSGGSALR